MEETGLQVCSRVTPRSGELTQETSGAARSERYYLDGN